MNKIKKIPSAVWMFVITNILFGLSILIAYYISYESEKLVLPTDRFAYVLNNKEEFTAEEIEASKKVSYLIVEYDQIPKDCIDSIIAIEDKTFLTNNGVDRNGLGRLIITAIPFLEDQGGGSTISQQVIKMYQDRYYNRTPYDKLKEMVWAFRLNQSFSKEEILELYLNNAYLGEFNYGIGAASKAYFDKDIEDLNREECAYLMALPQSPNTYLNNQERWDARKDLVLNAVESNSL